MLWFLLLLACAQAVLFVSTTSFCSLEWNTEVWCWGVDVYGKLGMGTNAPTFLSDPTPVPSSSGTTSGNLGDVFMCLDIAGAVFCSGKDAYGTLGNGGEVPQSSVLAPVHTLQTSVVKISGGLENTCAHMSNQSLVCWGGNYAGQLGRGNTAYGGVPQLMDGGSPIMEVAMLSGATCMVTFTGSVSCLGTNFGGLLGNNLPPATSTLVFLQVGGLESGVTQIDGKYGSVCALSTTVACWGSNFAGMLGAGVFDPEFAFSPQTQVTRGTPIATTIAASASCALYADTTMDCAGYNGEGQLSFYPYTNFGAQAIAVSYADSMDKIVQVVLSGQAIIVLMENGTVMYTGQMFASVPATPFPLFVTVLPVVPSPTQSPTTPTPIQPTRSPSLPTSFPSFVPTFSPTLPTQQPTFSPTMPTTFAPTLSPSLPTSFPTFSPSKTPTLPTFAPTKSPTLQPSFSPSKAPTLQPTKSPTLQPTKSPTLQPSKTPTLQPTKSPLPPTLQPTNSPTVQPTKSPTTATNAPTKSPTLQPTGSPLPPTLQPTKSPTVQPTKSPTLQPTLQPSFSPSKAPTKQPTKAPTQLPSFSPSKTPTVQPSKAPTVQPSFSPSKAPTKQPTKQPTTLAPTLSPSLPTPAPTGAPTFLTSGPTQGNCSVAGDEIKTVGGTSFCCFSGFMQELLVIATVGCSLRATTTYIMFGVFGAGFALTFLGAAAFPFVAEPKLLAYPHPRVISVMVGATAALGVAFSVTVPLLNMYSWASITLLAVWSGVFLLSLSFVGSFIGRPARHGKPRAGPDMPALLVIQAIVYACLVAALFMPALYYTPASNTIATQTRVTIWTWASVITVALVCEGLLAFWRMAPIANTTFYFVLAVLVAGTVGVAFVDESWIPIAYMGAVMVVCTIFLFWIAVTPVFKVPKI